MKREKTSRTSTTKQMAAVLLMVMLGLSGTGWLAEATLLTDYVAQSGVTLYESDVLGDLLDNITDGATHSYFRGT